MIENKIQCRLRSLGSPEAKGFNVLFQTLLYYVQDKQAIAVEIELGIRRL